MQDVVTGLRHLLWTRVTPPPERNGLFFFLSEINNWEYFSQANYQSSFGMLMKMAMLTYLVLVD